MHERMNLADDRERDRFWCAPAECEADRGAQPRAQCRGVFAEIRQ
jgi:hypothetical protein